MMQSSATKPATAWDSFGPTLIKVLGIVNPKTIFEYGPGVSTKIMATHPGVEIVDSVEDETAWYEKYRWTMPDNVQIYYQPVAEAYPETLGRVEKYDLIFVDGIERVSCLYVARVRLNKGGVVVLHDAERPNYREMIETYKYKFWTDEGHTVTLTDDDITAMRLEKLYD
jgi:hypothetical protein